MKKKIDKCYIIIPIILVILFFALFQIHELKNELKNMPKKVCHTEEKITKVELDTYCYSFNYITGEACVNLGYYFGDNEIICEEGVEIYLGEAFNFERNTTKICLVKTKEEICEIN